MNLITAHLSRLADFAGRENRKPFWLWVMTVYITQTVLGILIMIPLMVSFSQTLQPLMTQNQTYLNEHPEVASQMMFAAIVPLMRNFMIFGAVTQLVLYALIAAAVVRRLHDTDRTGWWAAPIAALQLGSLALYAIMLPRFFGAFGTLGQNPDPAAVNAAFGSLMPLFGVVWLLGMVGFVLMVILIVFCATRGTIGPNRYGDDLLPPPPVYPDAPRYSGQHYPDQQYPSQRYPGQQYPGQPAAPLPPARVVGPWDQQPPR